MPQDPPAAGSLAPGPQRGLTTLPPWITSGATDFLGAGIDWDLINSSVMTVVR